MDYWKDLFRTHILERGLNYYEQGTVLSLEKTENGYAAIVEGTDDYQVEIEISDDRVYNMSCTCPYAEDGNYCKHMAAVLYEIEDGKTEKICSPNWQERVEKNRNELMKVISKIPEDEMRRLLVDLAWKDDSLRNRILTTYSEKISSRQMIRLKKEIDEIAYQNSDRSGFVDYYHASDYVDALNNFLYDKVQALIDKKCYMQAFELTNHVFHCAGNQDMDDSDGGTSWVANTCYEFWQQILQKSGEEEKKQMFRWFQEHQGNGYVIDYMEEYIDDFLMNEFHEPDMLVKKLKFLDELIEKAGSSTDCGEWYSVHYGYENNIIKRLQIMKELGSSDQKIQEYRNKYRQFSSIRKLEVKEYLEKDQYEKAIEVLKESKKLDKEYAGLLSEYSRELIDIYKRIGQMDAYKTELEYQIFTCVQNDLQFVRMLKEQCNEKEWVQYREKILTSRTAWSIKYAFLEDEELFAQLLEEIVNSGSVYSLDQYEKVLKKKYPEKVRDAYINYVRKCAQGVTDRKRYKELMKYLKKISKYPDGKKKAQHIAEEWKLVYKRRPAMMDELHKMGF